MRGHDDAAGETTQADRGQHTIADGHVLDVGPDRRHVPGDLAAGNERKRGLDLVLPGHEEAVDEVHAGRLDGDNDLAGPGFGVGTLLHLQDGRWSQLIADGGAHERNANGQPEKVGWVRDPSRSARHARFLRHNPCS